MKRIVSKSPITPALVKLNVTNGDFQLGNKVFFCTCNQICLVNSNLLFKTVAVCATRLHMKFTIYNGWVNQFSLIKLMNYKIFDGQEYKKMG